jgi:hypothetical protein
LLQRHNRRGGETIPKRRQMLPPCQARGIGGQKGVPLNELLKGHAKKIVAESLASQHHDNLRKGIANFGKPPHPARPQPFFARAE